MRIERNVRYTSYSCALQVKHRKYDGLPALRTDAFHVMPSAQCNAMQVTDFLSDTVRSISLYRTRYWYWSSIPFSVCVHASIIFWRRRRTLSILITEDFVNVLQIITAVELYCTKCAMRCNASYCKILCKTYHDPGRHYHQLVQESEMIDSVNILTLLWSFKQ